MLNMELYYLSGKSTMFKLMANLYNEVENNAIMINDINVQEIVLLNLSVKENILIEIPCSKHHVYLKSLNKNYLTQKVKVKNK